MPRRDPDLLVEDILAAISKIERYIAGMNQVQFQEDDKTLDAVVRNLEIVGEAARQLPEEFAAQCPGVPWHQIRGMRNRIVHDYFGLDLEIIWQVISHDLPQLKVRLAELG